MVRVEAFLNDGTRMERTVEAPRGSEKKFGSDADIVEKFQVTLHTSQGMRMPPSPTQCTGASIANDALPSSAHPAGCFQIIGNA
jgi:hypothetical protein